jgi:hypothetical protein
VAGFFSNLTPLFAALMSTIWLGEAPRLFHFVAFALIVGGIVVSSRRCGGRACLIVRPGPPWWHGHCIAPSLSPTPAGGPQPGIGGR